MAGVDALENDTMAEEHENDTMAEEHENDTMAEGNSNVLIRVFAMIIHLWQYIMGSSPQSPPLATPLVWIGFMDIVPVIGSVKEAVELVLAIYEGDDEVIKKKENALKNFEIGHIKQENESATDATERSGLQNVTAVPNLEIGKYVNTVSKKQVQMEKEARARKLEEIREDVIKKLQDIDIEFKEELKEELKRSKRKEHVFNNGILKFHSKVLQKFCEKCKIESHSLEKFCEHTLEKEKSEIDVMVVTFDSEDFYVNANSILYGAYSKKLSSAFESMLEQRKKLFNNNMLKKHGQTPKKRVTEIIQFMNKNQIYVDQFAKEKWIGNDESRSKRVEKVRSEVAKMYETRGKNWCAKMINKLNLLLDSKKNNP